MSVIETFYLVFKSNSEDIVKGNKVVEKSTKDTERALKNTNDQTKSIGENFVKMVEAGATAIGTIAGFEILKGGVQTAIEMNTQLKLIGENAGVTAGQLRAAGVASQLFGGTAEMGQRDAIAMATARRKGQITGRDPAEMMKNIRDQVSVFPLDQQQNILEQVYGLSPAGVRQASSLVSDKEFATQWTKAQKDIAETNRAADTAYATNASEVDLSTETQGFFNRLLEQVAPLLRDILGKISGAVAGTGAVTGAAAVVAGETALGIGAGAILKRVLTKGGGAITKVATTTAGTSGLEAGLSLGGGSFAADAAGIGLAGLAGVGALAVGGVTEAGYGLYKGYGEYTKLIDNLAASFANKRRVTAAQSFKAAVIAEKKNAGLTLPTGTGAVNTDIGEPLPSVQDIINSPDVMKDLNRARGVSKSVQNARNTLSTAADLSPTTGGGIVLNIDKIEINTQATDAAGIATGIAGALENKIYTAMGFIAANADNGQSR